ncbi:MULTISPECIES: amidohydrolase family protein [unclassified Mycobacterium]|uniref:amidohydrolase family protein n=1 Tax=unclassified Mycobacterium TaxID=2642494 RepID=UPI0029C7DC9A|nr:MULTISPECIES: amidohydrolase family protein [unclassified Mycobacterium]
MPLQPWMKLLSTDDHLIEHPTVWSDRLPSRYREVGPQIIEQPRSAGGPPSEVWRYEGRIYPYIGLNAVAGKKPEEFGLEPTRYDEMIPGCYDPTARIEDMDIDGVWGAINFPSFPRFAGTVFLDGKDKELALLCVQAWNDFNVDEWCAEAPDRFIPMTVLPLWDVELCVQEIYRMAAKGSKCIAFPENPVPLGLPSLHTDHWNPVFAAATDCDMPLTMHFGTSGSAPITAPEAPMAVMITLFACNSMYALADLVFSPVFHNFPQLKVGLSEGGIGWLPYMLERMDATWERHRFYQNINQSVRPSDLFRRNVHGCFIDDFSGMRNRDLIGVDNITWESDYPHSDSYWPHSRKRASENFVDVPDHEVHKMVELNVRRLYNFPA